MLTVPMLDLSPITATGVGGVPTSEVARLAAELDEVCSTIGFAQLRGHGIDPTLMRTMLDVTASFFDLPLTTKRRFVPPHPGINRGYAAEGTEALAYSLGATDLPPDRFEAFNIGREGWTPGDPYYEAERDSFFAANLWPDEPAVFADVWRRYFNEIQSFCTILDDLFSLALGVPGFLRPHTDRAANVMRANNYQRRADAGAFAPKQMRMGAHTDYGVCTVLLADSLPGLQISAPTASGAMWSRSPAASC